MRITREALLKNMQETVDRRTRSDRNLLSIYLCGSLLEQEYMLGGTADIDLVFIHTDTITTDREIIPLTEEFHLDITHHFHRDYRQTRSLRVHPWLGPTLKSCHILFDPQHFMDFTQASVRGQFDRADYTLERSRKQAEHAREMWQGFHPAVQAFGPKEISGYLKAVDHAANAIALLTGPPLTERRFLQRFPERAEALQKPGLFPGLLGLLGAPHIDASTITSWLPLWRKAYTALPAEQAPARLHAARRAYYLRGFEALLKDPQPMAALWPVLKTWTQAIMLLPQESPEYADWQQAMDVLGLQAAGFVERLEALDAYLDMVEETLENWARMNGA